MRHFSIIALVLALAAPAQAQLADFTRTDLDDVTDDADVIFEGDSFKASDSSTDLVATAGLRYKAAERVELFGGLPGGRG